MTLCHEYDPLFIESSHLNGHHAITGSVAFVFHFDFGFVDVHLLVTRQPGDRFSINRVIPSFVDQQLMPME